MVTILTPTYNRACLLHRLYTSLCRQTCSDFVWIVVDDGSTDDTKNVVEKWIKERKIVIKYFYQENAGKMQAHNKGVRESASEYLLCVDSDDYLTDNAIQLISDRIEKMDDCFGIIAYKGFVENNSMPYHHFPKGLTESTLVNLYKSGFCGDTALVYKTDVLKNHLFPQFGNEKFITEAFVYDQIDQEGTLTLLDDVLIVCEYFEDGYTHNALDLYKKYPLGWRKFFVQRVSFSRTLREKVKYMSYSICYLILARKKKLIFDGEYPFLSIMCIPIGYHLYRRLMKNKRNDE